MAQSTDERNPGNVPMWLSNPVRIEAATIAKRKQAAIDAGHLEWAELPASWVRAKAAGAPKFFTGNPCSHGHVNLRYTDSRSCIACLRERAKGAK